MKQLGKDLAVAQTIILITSYSFELQGYTAEQLVSKWLTTYHPTWIRLATIEALYLGRYKAVSIEQIMSVWSRLGNPKVHFGGEFERLICRKLPRHLVITKDSNRVSQQHHTAAKVFDYPVDFQNVSGQKQPKNAAENSLASSYEPLNSENPQNSPKPLSQHHSSPSQSKSNSSASSVPSETLETQELIPSQSTAESSKTNPSHSIEGFTPIPDMSSLFQKLKAIAKPE